MQFRQVWTDPSQNLVCPFCHPGIPGDGWLIPLIPNNVASVAEASSSTRGLSSKPRQRLEQGNTQSSLLPLNIVYAVAQILLGKLWRPFLNYRSCLKSSSTTLFFDLALMFQSKRLFCVGIFPCSSR